MIWTWFSATVFAAVLTTAIASNAQASMDALRARFRSPPAEARPLVRWWWFGPAVTRSEITHELQEMQADGIGGVELAFVYPLALDDPAKGIENLPFLSRPMLDMVHFAAAEGQRLGLRVDVTLCSGWPYGGPHIPLAQAAGMLRRVVVDLSPGATSLPVPLAPNKGDTLIAASLVDGIPDVSNSANATALPLPAAATGRLAVPASTRARVAFFFFASHTRQQVKRAAVGAEGFVLDPFSREAVATHLRAVGEPLVQAFGATPPYAIFSDSLEAYGADWTPLLPSEFRSRRGYDLLPHLPELFAGGTPAAERIRHDYGRTLTELVNENYLTQINDWATSHRTRFRSQTYGEPAVSFSSQRLASLAEGEGSQWRQFSTLRWASSANHVFGETVTSGESFTWLHSPVFRATPLDMKAEADVDFLSGENEFFFHGWPYSPDRQSLQPGDPGWSLYAAAALNDHNPWHPVMPLVTQYIARISDLLRQGKPANQVAILLPTDDAWADFAPGNVSISAAMATLISPALMSAILSAGYNVDFIDAAAIETAGLGSHSIVVLPPTDRIPQQTLASLRSFANNGGHVVSVATPPTKDENGVPLATGAWGPSTFVQVSSVASLGDALRRTAAPDLQATLLGLGSMNDLGFLRRQLADADIYFVANTGNRELKASLRFATRFTRGERWNPDTGLVMEGAASLSTPVDLAPYESAIFVFSAHPSASPPAAAHSSGRVLMDLSSRWIVSFPAISKVVHEEKLTDWTADAATRHFSGEAVYTRDFLLDQLPSGRMQLVVPGGQAVAGEPDSLPPEATGTKVNGMPDPFVTKTGPGMRAWYDPPVREAALVTVNGKPAGSLWHPPYVLDVTALLRQGTNHIEIAVFNTALNAWSAAPKRNYSELEGVYGDRFQMQDLDKVEALPSGILGSIVLTGDAAK